MMYQALIKTTLQSRTQTGEQDKLTHTAVGMVSLRKDGGWTLRYHDPENGGETALLGTETWMTLRRDGAITSGMKFVVDEMLPALYLSEMGSFDMATRTDSYSVKVTDKSGRIALAYDLLLNGELAMQNRLEVTWKRI